ncbi:hypothetical protein ISN45_Aa01g030950, partial [Arabidopsis thaliana x Arabidopsis arenosa]
MGFAFVNDSGVQRIKSLKSNMGHFYFFSVHLFNITGVAITAPGDSPTPMRLKWVSQVTSTFQAFTQAPAPEMIASPFSLEQL